MGALKQKLKMAEDFNFSWDTFSEHTNELISELYSTGRFADITLVTDDQIQFKAHRFVLSACSSVFRNILDGDSNQTCIYLRGIGQHEIQSLLQFMYLGEATFKQERMAEFLNVAKDLDIKDIGQQQIDNGIFQVEEDKSEKVQDMASNEFVHEGSVKKEKKVKIFSCSKCDYKATSLSSRQRHEMAVHENVVFPCKLCDFRTSRRDNLKTHVRSMHDGVKYACTSCEYKASRYTNLASHIKLIHKGIRITCAECSKNFKKQISLRNHMKKKHNFEKEGKEIPEEIKC